MQPLVDFILIDGPQMTVSNLVSFFAFTVVVSGLVLMCQALMRPAVKF